MNVSSRSILLISTLTMLMLIFFQNCGKPFVNSSDSQGNFDSSSQQNITKSYLFMGHQGTVNGEIARAYVDHSDDSVHLLPSVQMPSGGYQGHVSWMQFDATTQRLFTLNDSSANSRVAIFDVNNQADLSPVRNYQVTNDGVHFSLFFSPIENLFFAGVSSYNLNNFSFYQFNPSSDEFQTLQSVVYPSGFKTHSSTLDSTRNLVLVANSGGMNIHVYRWIDSALTEVGVISGIVNPRIVLYNRNYDIVYVVTEDQANNSKVLLVKNEFNETTNSYTYQILEQHILSQKYGADIKIDEVNRYILATVRESGASGIELIPIRKNGMLDFGSKRSSHFIPTLNHPRSIDLSDDGKYIFVGYNIANQLDLTVYKMQYGANNEIVNNYWLGDYEMGGTQGFSCNLVVDLYTDETLK